MNRSNVLTSLSVVALSFLSACDRRAQPEPTNSTASLQLVVASWGGAYQEAQRIAFFEPFTKETGIRIVEETTPDYGKIYEWQRTGHATVDVVDVETYFVYQAALKGALLELDRALVPIKDLLPNAIHSHGVASCAYADVIAWNSERHPDWSLTTWQEFWDTARFPGPRGLRDLPASTLEAACLASGVPPDRLYPLDVDQAFQALTSLRQHSRIALWSAGSQPIEWLLSGSVDITTAWNGRVYDAQREGKPIAMTYENAMLDWLWWVVPKHSKNPQLAMRFIAFTLRPDRQAELARHIPYGPTNTKAIPLLDQDTLRRLPTAPENLKQLLVRDNEWWAQSDELIQPKWREWKLNLRKP